MKLTISVLFVLIAGAAAQDGTGQERGLIRLEQGRNTQVVGACSRTAASLLSCSLLGNDLTISGQLHVTSITFFIRLCDSSLLVNLTLSNGTELTAVDSAQCDTAVTLGQLMLAINVAVFVDSDGLTVINTSVDAGDVALFGMTSIPLTQQDAEACQDGIAPPPASCNPTTITRTSTTTMAAESTTSQSRPTTGSGTTFYGHMLLITVASALTLL